jgi:hypothetical protein
MANDLGAFAPVENDAAQPFIELTWPCSRCCCDNGEGIVITDELAASIATGRPAMPASSTATLS